MGNSNIPLVSVVTPVYNGDKYLAECIESVLEQTYSNWEYIILNNCSTDNTLQVAEHYAQKDNRIKVYTNDDFLKQIPNWNKSLELIASDSKYCKMVHADDWLYPECIEKLVARAEEYPEAGIISSYRFTGSEVGKVHSKGLPYTTTFLWGKEVVRRMLLDGLFVFGTPTTILYRTDLVKARELFYDSTVVHAETDICFDILQETDFAFVHQLLSFTRLHDGAATNFADHYNTYVLFDLYAIKKYGNYYLSDEEYEQVLSRKLLEEHRWLIRSFLKGIASDVWPYHKKELAEMGLKIKWTGMLKAFFVEIFGIFRTDKLSAFKNRIEQLKKTPSDEEAVKKEIIEAKKNDTALSR